MPFSTDSDLLLFDASAQDLLNTSGGSVVRAAAEKQMLHKLHVRWYRPAAATRNVDWRARPMDPARLEPLQLATLSILETLAFLFGSQAKNGREPDGLERKAALYRQWAEDELKALMEAGVDYDWDAGPNGIEPEERAQALPRKLRAYRVGGLSK